MLLASLGVVIALSALVGGQSARTDGDKTLRRRVVTDAGVLLIYDATTPPGNRRVATGYLAYWEDSATGAVSFYDQLLFTSRDVGRALIAAQRVPGIDLNPIAERSEVVARWIDGARRGARAESRNAEESGSWTPLTYEASAAAMGFDIGGVATGEIGPQPKCTPGGTQASRKPVGRHIRSNRKSRLAAVTLAAPPAAPTPRQRIDFAVESVLCPGGGGGGGGGVVPFSCSTTIADALNVMSNALDGLLDAEGTTASLDLSVPTTTVVTGGAVGAFTILIADASGVKRQGTGTVTGCLPDGTVGLLADLSDDDGVNGETRHWTLHLSFVSSGEVLTMAGSLVIDDVVAGQTTYTGGWLFSPTGGPLEDPNSDPGFSSGVIEMFHIVGPPGSVAALSLASILKLIGNLAELGINYLVDLLTPYTPPSSCSGPSISGSSCAGNVPCSDKLQGLCEQLDDIPNVTDAFKQCMKGRCGCGGSHHKRAAITCADSTDCGPCGANAGGCNIAGSQLWYCQADGADVCTVCANTVFHEMGHACGEAHNVQYYMERKCNASDNACRIGDWFGDQCGIPGVSGTP